MVSFRGRRGSRIISSIWTEQDAAVTVYFLIAGAALLMLFLAVFNYGRYLLATRQAELALEASAASVLSYYETALTQEMGMFALDTRDADLRGKGEAYFTDNLGSPESFHGQRRLSYSVSFPEAGRLDNREVLAAQTMEMKRYESWSSLCEDILKIFGMSDWQGFLKQLGESADPASALGLPGIRGSQSGYPGEGGGMFDEEEGFAGIAGGSVDLAGIGDTDAAPGEAETPEWLKTMEENVESDRGKWIKSWQFLSPRPPKDIVTDRSMPAAVSDENFGEKSALDDKALFWVSMFSAPSMMAQDGGAFLGETVSQIGGFMFDIKGSLIEALSKGVDKFQFNSYLLSELDFATNKPVVDRYFSRCEVEYIICGFDKAWDNLRHIALRLFLMRASLHFINSAIGMEIVDESTLAVALMQAVMKGSLDMEKLFAGERVALFPGEGLAAFVPDGLEMTLSYKDHLRIFLMCQREEEQRKALQRLVQVNLWHWAGGASGGAGSGPQAGGLGFADFPLSRYATEVQIAAETEFSLWPFGAARIRREGVMGYNRPFTLLSPE